MIQTITVLKVSAPNSLCHHLQLQKNKKQPNIDIQNKSRLTTKNLWVAELTSSPVLYF
jgi:hypothetical protein